MDSSGRQSRPPPSHAGGARDVHFSDFDSPDENFFHRGPEWRSTESRFYCDQQEARDQTRDFDQNFDTFCNPWTNQKLKLICELTENLKRSDLIHSNVLSHPQKFFGEIEYDDEYSACNFLESYLWFAPAARHGKLNSVFQIELPQYLDGWALEWFKLEGHIYHQWENFCSEFLLTFRDEKSDRIIRDKIENRRQQAHETFAKYACDLSKLFNELFFAPSEPEKLNRFICNLSPRYKSHIRGLNFNYMHVFCKKMREVDREVEDETEWYQWEEPNHPYSQYEARQQTHFNDANFYMQELERERERARAEKMLQRQQSPSFSPMRVQVKAPNSAASGQPNYVHDQRNSAPTAGCETRSAIPHRETNPDRDDVRAPNKTEILVGDSKYNFACPICGMRGHAAHSCPEKIVKNKKILPSINMINPEFDNIEDESDFDIERPETWKFDEGCEPPEDLWNLCLQAHASVPTLNVVADEEGESRENAPYKEISLDRDESRAPSELEIESVSGHSQNLEFYECGIKGGQFVCTRPEKLVQKGKLFRSISMPDACETRDEAPRRPQRPDIDNTKIISTPFVLQPNFDSSITQRINKKNCFINHVLDLHADERQIPKIESAELTDNLLTEQQNIMEFVINSNITPLQCKITEIPIKRKKVNFVPRVKFENLNCCNFNLKEPLNWLFETSNEDKKLATESKYDEKTNLIENVNTEISTPTIEHLKINSFKSHSTTEIMLYIYVAEIFFMICKTFGPKSMISVQDHEKLNFLNFKPLLLKAPVPKLAPKAKLFHIKLPVRLSFKIKCKQRENCKLIVSAFSLDEANTDAQPSELSIRALEVNVPDAPDNAVRKSAPECSRNEIPMRKVGLMVSTMKIKLGIPYFPKVKIQNYLEFNKMIDICDKPYERDVKYVDANTEKVQLNGWPPPVGIIEEINF
jgi:hypothetical protein